MHPKDLNSRLTQLFKGSGYNPYRAQCGRFTSADNVGGGCDGVENSSGSSDKVDPNTLHDPEKQIELIENLLNGLEPPIPPPRGDGIAQPGVRTIEELYKQADVAQGQYDKMMAKVEAELGAKTMHINSVEDYNSVLKEFEKGKKGPVVVVAALKGRKRLSQKIQKDYNGDVSKIGDVVRGTVAVDTIYEMDEVLNAFSKSGVKLAREPKDRVKRPTPSGYRDLMLNVTLPNGHIAELQVNTKAMFLAKDVGHLLYERERELEPFINARAASMKEQLEYFSLQRQQREIYDDAWKKSR